MSLPWESGYQPPTTSNDLLKSLENVLHQGIETATTVGSELAGSVAGPAAAQAVTEVGSVIAGAEHAVGGVVEAGPASPAPSTPTASAPPPGDTNLISELEKAALDAARGTTGALLPSLERAIQVKVAATVQKEIGEALIKIQGGVSQPVVPTPEDFTKADARSRAARTLVVGLALSVGWGIVNVLGNLATVDWGNKNALPQVTAIAVSSIIGSVLSYVGRIFKEPASAAQATIITSASTAELK